MIEEVFLRYLFSDGFNFTDVPSFQISSDIEISLNGKVYRENLFSIHELNLSEEEKSEFLNLIKIFSGDWSLIQGENCNFNFPLLKIASIFITEQYFEKCAIDKHGRVLFSSEFKFSKEFFELPIVDFVASYFVWFFSIKRQESFVYLTSDFDILDVYKDKKIITVLNYLVSYFKLGDFKGLIRNIFLYFESVFGYPFGNPFLNSKMFEFNDTSNKVRNVIFWLIDNSNNIYDIDNDFSDQKLADFIESMRLHNVVFGLHPSYNTLENYNLLIGQVDRFAEIFSYPPQFNRYHYLRVTYPSSIKDLEKNGFTDDFSFAFVDSLAFRAGKASPFRYWCLEDNRPFDVMIHPITIMDGTLHDYMNLNENEALDFAKEKILSSKKFGTEINLLWHNRSMFTYGFPNNYYHKIYPEILNLSLK
jgi:hypothetical protein